MMRNGRSSEAIPTGVSRRQVLAAAAASSWLTHGLTGRAAEAPPVARERRVDIHVHLFGIGDNGSGCRLSPTIVDGPFYKMLTVLLGIDKQRVDGSYLDILVSQIRQSPLDQAAIVGLDAV